MRAWHAGPADVQRVFAEQNPWHLSGKVPEVLAHTNERPLARSLWSRLVGGEPRRFQLILGPRRVGKTTVMYQTVRHLLEHGVAPQDLWWLGLDHPLLMQESLGDLVRSVIATRRPAEDRPVTLFLDEIVYAEDWDLWLKEFHDERWPVRVVATSSATAALRDRRQDGCAGRWQDQYLMPYLYGEFLDLLGVPFDLDVGPTLADTIGRLPGGRPAPPQLASLRRDFLLTGGFPDLLTVRPPEADEQGQLLRSQQALRGDAVERAVYKDIPQSFGLDSPMLLERLLYALAWQIGGLVSAKSIGEQLGGMSQPTFDRYLTYLQRAFLVFTLSNFSGEDGGVQRRGRKVYFVDGAIRNAALQRGLAPLDNPTEMGLLIENLAASTLHSLAIHSGLRLFHWRDGKHAVDLLLDGPESPIAFQIATSADHPRTSLVALMERHPSLRGRCHLVAPRATTVVPDAHPSGVGTIPLDTFLVAASRQAEAALKNKQS